MRALVKTSKLPSVLAGTLVLALTANAYELLCTAGFPMIYTRILTLHQLQPWQHYLFLGFYCLIYVLPLLTIVLIFTWTLGSKKLGERQGRILKLLSGVMMLLLGGLLLAAPELLTNPLAAVVLLVLAPAAVALLVWLDGRFRPRHRCDR
jgi:drug/metabolite transporter (DMT)-like permease